MRLRTEFLKLPYRFDVDRLVQEVNSIDQREWIPHPTGFKGNTSIPLISMNGEKNDLFAGPMKPTAPLLQCEYIQQIIATFDSVIGRSRLMRLEGRSEVPEHSDINYHWYNRVRIHIPVVTDPCVRFICNHREINMQPGETWIFDTWKLHQVINQNDIVRIHLVIDTCGSANFWKMVAMAKDPFDTSTRTVTEPAFVPFIPGKAVTIRAEKYNSPSVMSPGELDALTQDLLADVRQAENGDQLSVEQFTQILFEFSKDWRQIWLQHGDEHQGLTHYQSLIDSTRNRLKNLSTPPWLASNLTDATNTFNARVLTAALSGTMRVQTGIDEYGNNSLNTSAINPVRAKSRPGRNDPCPCGSGKKYKRCHG